MKLYNKAGAMFGLDARIALAIFGALSVISGAALYSAIESAKSDQWRQYFVEIVKSTEQYYLDNGQQLPFCTSSYDNLCAGDLINNRESLSSWNGPYFGSQSSSAATLFGDSILSQVGSNPYVWVFLRKGSDWAVMDDITSDEKCVVADSNCYEWIVLDSRNSAGVANFLNLFNRLDSLIDGGDGSLTGKLRYNTHGSDYIMYKGIPHKR